MYQPPTAARCAPRVVLTFAKILDLELGVVDISSAFTKSHPVHSSQRCILILPPYLPRPWLDALNLSDLQKQNNFRGVKHGVITIKPIYGTTCAPLRWFARLSEAFRLKKWVQCETDPCLFRLSSMDKVLGMEAVHVEDVLFAMGKSPWFRFGEVVNQFQHSGIAKLVPGVAAIYLGLDLVALSYGSIEMSQKSFAVGRLQLLEEADYRPTGKALAPPAKKDFLYVGS